MAYSTQYNNNPAYREFTQNLCADFLKHKFELNDLETVPNPGADPNWDRNLITNYNVSADIWANDWKEEIATQKAAKGYT